MIINILATIFFAAIWTAFVGWLTSLSEKQTTNYSSNFSRVRDEDVKARSAERHPSKMTTSAILGSGCGHLAFQLENEDYKI